MNAPERLILWKRLQDEAIVQGEMPADVASPWYIRVMLGCTGWIGALFILGFIAGAFSDVLRSGGATTVASVICFGIAYWLFRNASSNDFASQFGLAIGLCGQILICFAVFDHYRVATSIGFFLFFCIEAALTFIMPNFIHRTITAFAAVGAASLGFAQAGIHGIALPLAAAGCAVVWRNEHRLAVRSDLWQPVGYGLALGVLQTATTLIFGGELHQFFGNGGYGWLQRHGPALGTTLVSMVFLAVTVNILHQQEIKPSSREGICTLCSAVFVMIVSFPAHGFAAALLILILGFAGGNRVLCGLGLLALASFISHYYYQMHETLLDKSLILAATGAILLLSRWGLKRLFPAKEAQKNA